MNIDRRTLLATAPALALGAPSAVAQSIGGRPRTHALIGQAAPDFNLPVHGGGRFSRASLTGKTTIIEFWGLWCPDCLLDSDNVNALWRRVRRERDMAMMTIHTRGRFGRWGDLASYFAEKRYSYPVALDDDSATYRAFQMQWVPGFLVIDRQGVIRDFTNDLGAGGGIGVRAFFDRARRVARARS